MPLHLAQRLECDVEPDPSAPRMWTRFGLINGRLERVRVAFPAEEGDTFELDATWFVSAEWPGPAVIGWKGCLERMRFAFDPATDSFYFGDL